MVSNPNRTRYPNNLNLAYIEAEESDLRDGMKALFEMGIHATLIGITTPEALRALLDENASPVDVIVVGAPPRFEDAAQILRRLREHPVHGDARIVVFDHALEPQRIEQLKTAGADAYVEKPLAAEPFREAFRSLLTSPVAEP